LICTLRYFVGRSYPFHIFLGGLGSGMISLLIEHPSRRAELTTYTFANQLPEAIYRMLAIRGYLPLIRFGDVLAFVAAMTTICYFYYHQPSEHMNGIGRFMKFLLGDSKRDGYRSKDEKLSDSNGHDNNHSNNVHDHNGHITSLNEDDDHNGISSSRSLYTRDVSRISPIAMDAGAEDDNDPTVHTIPEHEKLLFSNGKKKSSSIQWPLSTFDLLRKAGFFSLTKRASLDTTITFLRGFGIGFSLRGGLAFLSNLLGKTMFLRPKQLILSSFGRNAIEFGMFIATLVATWRGVLYLLQLLTIFRNARRSMIRNDMELLDVRSPNGAKQNSLFLCSSEEQISSLKLAWRELLSRRSHHPLHSMIAGACSGLSIVFARSSDISMYFFSKALEAVYNLSLAQGILKSIPFGGYAAFCLGCGVLFYCAVLEPFNIRSSYFGFLNKASGNRFYNFEELARKTNSSLFQRSGFQYTKRNKSSSTENLPLS